jgi:mannosyltransferase
VGSAAVLRRRAAAQPEGRRVLLGASPASLAVAALTLAAAALRWPTLAGGSFWVDEWVTSTIVERPLLDMLRSVKATESTPPLYYVLAWAWAHLFGTGELALRSLSALFGAATVPVAYAAGSALASRRAGFVAACFVAVNPLLVWYSTEARAYSLLVLLGAVTFLFFAQALSRPRSRALALWSLAGSLALATHYFAVFFLAAEALVLFFLLRQHRRYVSLALVPITATGVALLPLVYWQAGHASWIVDLPFGERLGQIPRQFAVGVSGVTGWREVAVAVLAAAALLMLVRADLRERRAAAIALAVGILALAIPLLFALERDYVLTRNVLAAWLPLALAAAVACAARRAGGAGLLVAAGLCAVWLSTVVAVASDRQFQRGDWKEAARLIGPATRDRLVLAWGDWGASPLEDHLPRARRIRPREAARVAEIAIVGFDRPARDISSCWTGSACNMADVRPHPEAAPTGFAFAGRRGGARFEVLRFRATKPVPVTWREATRIETRYGLPAIWFQPSPGSVAREAAPDGRNH